MSNIIRLRGKPSHAPAPNTSLESSLVASETINRLARMQLAVKGRLQATLSLLDITFTNIRHLNAMIADPAVRAVVESELATLEAALSSARVRTLEI